MTVLLVGIVSSLFAMIPFYMKRFKPESYTGFWKKFGEMTGNIWGASAIPVFSMISMTLCYAFFYGFNNLVIVILATLIPAIKLAGKNHLISKETMNSLKTEIKESLNSVRFLSNGSKEF
ncbi:hypothetical protein AKJ61_01545 [candidate division MSBL1 archaeon SCGC-AAA259B11]|uniref:Uncharacterized protein n=1 Tax=candidate division MSBL1 archaeon SCGC-AAA259B11 TaxID=1698260 RepID=A0A133U778_9EURY|nr:hypothetical protein AKJ61_01545 [candidate division MSBL1 archaeon SCGC-AAA259B11]